jgi:hypothetical protein
VENIVGVSQIVISGAMSILAYAMVVLVVVKIFKVSNEVAEVKELLLEIKRNTEDLVPASVAARAQSPESLIRAVNASSYQVEGRGEPAKANEVR